MYRYHLLALVLAVMAIPAFAAIAHAEGNTIKEMIAARGWQQFFGFENTTELQQLQNIVGGTGGSIVDGKLVNFTFTLNNGVVAFINAKLRIGELDLTDRYYDVLMGQSRNGTILVYYAPDGEMVEPAKYEFNTTSVQVEVVEADAMAIDTEAVLMRAVRRPGPGWHIVFASGVCSDRWLGPYNVGRNARVQIYFDESHTRGDVDLRIYDGGTYRGAIFADFRPQTRTVVIASGQLRLFLDKLWGHCQQTVVAYKVLSAGTQQSVVTQTRTVTVTQPVTVTVTRTIERSHTVTVTQQAPQNQGQGRLLSGSGFDFNFNIGDANPAVIVLIVVAIVAALIVLMRR